MSMVSEQCHKLRETAEKLREHGTFAGFGGTVNMDPLMSESATLMCGAADTIWELRNAAVDATRLRQHIAEVEAEEAILAVKLHDEHIARQNAEADNAKLRELVRDWRDFAVGGADSLPDWNSIQADLEARMREFGVEVD